MAVAMLTLVIPSWSTAPGLLRNCWERLRRKLQQSRPGFPSLPWGPALAVQGPVTFTEPATDTNGSKENSSLLDSIFWMAAPKNRRSIEVNRCRRRNIQKLIKVKGPWGYRGHPSKVASHNQRSQHSLPGGSQDSCLSSKIRQEARQLGFQCILKITEETCVQSED
ncbi:large ribosomal subunit protein bL32m isoform 3-T3 [Hipposideros larvatus]